MDPAADGGRVHPPTVGEPVDQHRSAQLCPPTSAFHPALMLWPSTSSNGAVVDRIPEMASDIRVAVELRTCTAPTGVVAGAGSCPPGSNAVAAPPGAEESASSSRSNPTVDPEVDWSVWLPAASGSPDASGPHSETVSGSRARAGCASSRSPTARPACRPPSAGRIGRCPAARPAPVPPTARECRVRRFRREAPRGPESCSRWSSRSGTESTVTRMTDPVNGVVKVTGTRTTAPAGPSWIAGSSTRSERPLGRHREARWAPSAGRRRSRPGRASRR